VGVTGPQAFGIIAGHLKAAGEGGLRRELYKAINDAAKPLAREISNVAHLKPYLPDRYAAVLATELSVGTQKLAGANPALRLRVTGAKEGRQRRRKVALLDAGRIDHPVFGDRENWVHGQTGGMRPGFFSDPTQRAAPQVREAILAAMTETVRKASRKV